MYKKNGQLHYSPSDLTLHMESPFASWMDRYELEHPQNCPERDPVDPLLETLAQKGYSHESSLIASLTQDGHTIQDIGETEYDEKFGATVAAMKNGVDVIVQGRLESSNLGGFADFL